MFKNYFTLFEIEPVFDINFGDIEKKYIELIKIDINERQSKNMKNINKAYHTLKSPLKRAEYLLYILGIEIQKDCSNFEVEVLDESIKIREFLLECDDLQFASRMINGKIENCINNLIDAFGAKNFSKAVMQVVRLRYLYKSLEEIKKNATNTDF
ncbi:MAG: Fe-S protein assembly co-chaperone HscB [Wolbachia endosymbiont of Meromenopon meropis]|nr:Fe-S protein assembly co-chaperone HscB [Wolbachia endosymbiont of Meromenopon meropis]